jgi:hypothetical protein
MPHRTDARPCVSTVRIFHLHSFYFCISAVSSKVRNERHRTTGTKNNRSKDVFLVFDFLPVQKINPFRLP